MFPSVIAPIMYLEFFRDWTRVIRETLFSLVKTPRSWTALREDFLCRLNAIRVSAISSSEASSPVSSMVKAGTPWVLPPTRVPYLICDVNI